MKYLYIFFLPLFFIWNSCEKIEKINNFENTNAENFLGTSNDSLLSLNKSIKYISWENTINFLNDEKVILYTFDEMKDNYDQLNGTYTINMHNNLTFLDIHFDITGFEKWLILANGTLCDIYRPDGKNIHGVTGSIDRNENFGLFFKSINASSYLTENNKLYSSSNLGIYYTTDMPWVEGVSGFGINEKIFFEKGIIPNGSMHISIGYVSYDKPYLYEQNSRPKTIKLSIENKFSIFANLNDTPNYQEIKFPSDIGEDDILILEIIDIYPGTIYDDTCINSILFEINSGFYERNDYWE